MGRGSDVGWQSSCNIKTYYLAVGKVAYVAVKLSGEAVDKDQEFSEEIPPVPKPSSQKLGTVEVVFDGGGGGMTSHPTVLSKLQ